MNEIIINSDIGKWSISSLDVINQLKEMSGDVTVKISSNGGDVFQGIEIHNAFNEYYKGNINIVITSIAASIASYIALAGDSIKAYDNATFMIHNAWTFAAGDHNELRKTADIVEGLSSIMSKKYASKTGKSIEDINVLMDDSSFYYGDEILNNGFCDEIIATDEDSSKKEAVALAREGFKASCKNVSDNFTQYEFFQSAAKFKEEGLLNKVLNDDIGDVNDDMDINSSHEQRVRNLKILEQGMKI